MTIPRSIINSSILISSGVVAAAAAAAWHHNNRRHGGNLGVRRISAAGENGVAALSRNNQAARTQQRK